MKEKKPNWRIFIILLLIIGAAASLIIFYNTSYLRDSYTRKPLVKEKILFDTLVTVKAYGKNGRNIEKAVNQALERMEKIDKKMNYFSETSDLSRINQLAHSRKIKLSKELTEIISLSKKYNSETEGDFDITIAPVEDLWSFGAQEYVPTKDELDRVLPLVNSNLIYLDVENNSIQLDKKKMKLDLGGVAKGYATDKAIKILKRNGIESALVTTGSTTKVLGNKQGGDAWQVGIEPPRKKQGLKLLGILSVSQGESMSTSGDYQQYFIKDSVRYHHILHPQTGMPAWGLVSVTVLTNKSCAEADILSTAIFIMGKDKGMKYIKKNKDIEGVLIDSQGKILISPGLEGKVKNLPGKV